MPGLINILDDDIALAEQAILGSSFKFDTERRNFIKNLDTIDLQAVPGSGKTTSLLAKLIIMDRFLPFEDDSGILILSHTNNAVDEIKNRLCPYCTKIINYPNFIGTIQNFVDQFLAIPCYTNLYHKKPYRIDDQVYRNTMDRCLGINFAGVTRADYSNMKYFLLANKEIQYNYRFLFRSDGYLDLVKNINGDTLNIHKPKRNIKTYVDFSQIEKDNIKKALIKLKKKILEEGVLHFDDAYSLGDYYLLKHPQVIEYLQKRFKYVFVDEMQDMDSHQYNILEKIFYDDGRSISKYQRIGDKNQAIFNEVRSDTIWQNRSQVLNINGSYRLSPQIADVVNCFALSRDGTFKVNGLNPTSILPHIFVYDDSSKSMVIDKFAQTIKKLKEEGKLGVSPTETYKAIAWRRSNTDSNSLALSDYFKDYQPELQKTKIVYSSLKDHILIPPNSEQGFNQLRKNILNGIVHILWLEEISHPIENVRFTKKTFLEYLKDNFINEYDQLNKNLYEWSLEIIRGNNISILESIRQYIPHILGIFNKNIVNSTEFINSDTNTLIAEDAIPHGSNPNILIKEDVTVELATVHAVKGQTHTATLYLETSYQGKCESDRMINEFKGQFFSDSRAYNKQSTKMLYVGLSRPTHLLGIAIHEARWKQIFCKDIEGKYVIVKV